MAISLCPAVVARITETVVAEALAPGASETLRLGMPSGVLTLGTDVTRDGGTWVAQSGPFYRTARRLFDGRVWVPMDIVGRP